MNWSGERCCVLLCLAARLGVFVAGTVVIHIVVELLSGEKQTLELGLTVPGMPRGQESVFARTADTPDRIGVIPLKTIIKLRSAFSR